MSRMAKAALITQLIERLREEGSWCGETHVQKAVYFLQNLTKVPLKFDFILYKHGPFSFDLRDELTALRADGLLKLENRELYGARIAATRQSSYIRKFYPRTLSRHKKAIDFTSGQIGKKGVVELERLATALYVTRQSRRRASIDNRVKTLVTLKPHIPEEDAQKAVSVVDHMIELAQDVN